MVKRVLMIAFQYPPMRGSSGIQRTLKFSQYLPEFGWDPIVLTAHPRAYSHTSNDQLDGSSDQVAIHRAFALDASRHLSFRRYYPGWLALPDRWISWWLGAVPMGLYLIRKYRPDVIWSTYPIATTHLIGLSLCRLTGLPWVADLRDPMTDLDYPPDPRIRRAHQWIEEKTVNYCKRAVLTTPGAIDDYKTRFPRVSPSRFHLIENGYDEESFAEAGIRMVKKQKTSRPFVLVHSGVIYPSERDPSQFFEALAVLSREGAISATSLNVTLRATGHDDYLRRMVDRYAIGDVVSLAPPIPYKEALSEMLAADGLLILQASNCNNQIPAKLYEYLRARRPILALTDPAGNTACALREAGIDTIAPLDSRDVIIRELLRFVGLAQRDEAPIALMEKILASSRRSRTRELATLLDSVTLES
ncbi:MAG: glycosyltransferase [Nitrosospira sp.]|nr:glycosyltransferase [Nitrosospira sp.]